MSISIARPRARGRSTTNLHSSSASLYILRASVALSANQLEGARQSLELAQRVSARAFTRDDPNQAQPLLLAAALEYQAGADEPTTISDGLARGLLRSWLALCSSDRARGQEFR